MKFSFIIACVFILAKSAAQCPRLVWSDEFNGPTLDLNKWSFQTGDGCDMNLCGWGNNELEYYTNSTDNISVNNGLLSINARRQTINNRNYTSGKILTKNKFDFKYGYIEARMKLPTGKGMWPAFWMLPTDNVYGAWPTSGELDIMESLGHATSTVYGTIHYGNPWPNNSSSSKQFDLPLSSFDGGYHTIGLEWNEKDIKWMIDGYIYSQKTTLDVSPFKWPFDQKFHFIINLAVGGNWPGNPDGSTILPQTFTIDYVRVYDNTPAIYLNGKSAATNKEERVQYSLFNVQNGSSIVWTVPEDATIVSGQGTSILIVNFGNKSGTVKAVVKSDCGESSYQTEVKVDPALIQGRVLENFDDESLVTKGFVTGVYTDNVNNPNTNNSVNSSKLCGKYVRDGNSQYDVFFYTLKQSLPIEELVSGKKKFSIDLFTDAPVGTTVLVQLENSNRANSSNYPTGRHSRYQVITGKQNTWERLTIPYLDRPDAFEGVVNQIVILFAPNTKSGNTYYFDNFLLLEESTPVSNLQRVPPLKMYPNPGNGIYFVNEKITEIKRINIYTCDGSLIQSGSIKNNQIDITNQCSGVYFYEAILNGNKRSIGKLIKQ